MIVSEDVKLFEQEPHSTHCPVCYKRFVDPVQLECGHNVCKTCLDKLANEASCAKTMRDMSLPTDDKITVSCPVCGNSHNKGKEKLNEELKSLVEKVGRKVICDNCNKNDAVCFCPDCRGSQEGRKTLYCAECRDKLHSGTVLKDHRVRNILYGEDLSECFVHFDGAVLDTPSHDGDKYPICLKHRKPVSVCDKESKQLYCDVCFRELEGQKQHNIDFLSCLVSDINNELDDSLDEVSSMIEKDECVKKRIDTCKSLVEELEKSRKENCDCVEEYIAGYMKVLNEAKEKALKFINESFDQHEKLIKRLEEECNNVVSGIGVLKQHRAVSSEWNDFQTVMIDRQLKELKQRVESALKEMPVGDTPVKLEIQIKLPDIPKTESVIVVSKKITKKRDEKPAPAPAPAPAPKPNPAPAPAPAPKPNPTPAPAPAPAPAKPAGG